MDSNHRNLEFAEIVRVPEPTGISWNEMAARVGFEPTLHKAQINSLLTKPLVYRAIMELRTRVELV